MGIPACRWNVPTIPACKPFERGPARTGSPTHMQTIVPKISIALAAFALAAPSPAQLPGRISAGSEVQRGPLVRPPSAPVRALKTQIMCIGDSNTHGVNGHASYRYPLWARLFSHRSVVEFVGTRYTVSLENGTTIPDLNIYNRYYTLFDRDHQAYDGYRTDQVEPLLPFALRTERPDLVILMIGTNDIGQLGMTGVQHSLDGITDIVKTVRQSAPATTFLLASLPPIGPGNGYFANEAHIPTFNAQLPALATTLDLPHSRTVFTDVYTALDVNTDMQSDGLHPNVAGQDKVAAVFQAEVLKTIAGLYRPVADPVVTIIDPSFESLGLADGIHSTATISGWEFPQQSYLVAGEWNPDDLSYTGALLNGTPSGAEGDEILSLENLGGDPADGWVWQTLSTTLEPDTAYGLKVAVGHRAATSPRTANLYGGYEIEFLAGNHVIQSSFNTVTPTPGTFETDTLIVDSKGLPQDLIGAPLTVRMRLTWNQAGCATDFDAIDLQAN